MTYCVFPSNQLTNRFTNEISNLRENMKEYAVDKIIEELQRNRKLNPPNGMAMYPYYDNCEIEEIRKNLLTCEIEVLQRRHEELIKENQKIYEKKEALSSIKFLSIAFGIKYLYPDKKSIEELQEILKKIRTGNFNKEEK